MALVIVLTSSDAVREQGPRLTPVDEGKRVEARNGVVTSANGLASVDGKPAVECEMFFSRVRPEELRKSR